MYWGLLCNPAQTNLENPCNSVWSPECNVWIVEMNKINKISNTKENRQNILKNASQKQRDNILFGKPSQFGPTLFLFVLSVLFSCRSVVLARTLRDRTLRDDSCFRYPGSGDSRRARHCTPSSSNSGSRSLRRPGAGALLRLCLDERKRDLPLRSPFKLSARLSNCG